MVSELAGFYMMMKVKCSDIEIPYIKEKTSIERRLEYEYKADDKEAKEDYEKSKMPESGFMLRSEYEDRSLSKDKNTVKIPPAQRAVDSDMKYVPVPKYKLVKYNSAPGFTELKIPRRLNFDREISGQGIVSSDFKFMVYPAIHYYASADCTAADLYKIPLDTSLSELERVKQANIIRRDIKPILSTDKDIDTPYIFRTLTPIDFTPDNKKLLIKEKTGYRFDGIWKTDIWIYDFENSKSVKLSQLRDAIINYWKKTKSVNLSEQRWDIYPMGFDKSDSNSIIVCAYAYTGSAPVFLGAWSINVQGTSPKLIALSGTSLPISMVGYKLEYDGNETRKFVEDEVKKAENIEQERKKEAQKSKKQKDKELEKQYKAEQYQREAEYLNRKKECHKQNKYADKKYDDNAELDTAEE